MTPAEIQRVRDIIDRCRRQRERSERVFDLLVKAYWAAKTPREENLVRTLFQAFGYPDPLYGEAA